MNNETNLNIQAIIPNKNEKYNYSLVEKFTSFIDT